MRNRGQASKTKATARSYIPDDEEQYAFIKSAFEQTPTAATILGASFVEFTLDLALQSAIQINDDETWSTLIGDNGPLSSFYQKALMGYALGVYKKDLLTNLKVIKDVRNNFAHPRKELDFSSEEIVRIVKRAVMPESPSDKKPKCPFGKSLSLWNRL